MSSFSRPLDVRKYVANRALLNAMTAEFFLVLVVLLFLQSNNDVNSMLPSPKSSNRMLFSPKSSMDDTTDGGSTTPHSIQNTFGAALAKELDENTTDCEHKQRVACVLRSHIEHPTTLLTSTLELSHPSNEKLRLLEHMRPLSRDALGENFCNALLCRHIALSAATSDKPADWFRQHLEAARVFRPHGCPADALYSALAVKSEYLERGGETLGGGGFGEVRRVKLANTETTIAVKTPRTRTRSDLKQGNSNSLKNEVAMMIMARQCQPDLPNSGISHCLGTEPKRNAVLMELIEGRTFDDALWDRKVVMSWKQRFTVVAQVAKTVACLHDAKIIHNDLKPTNVMVRCGEAASVRSTVIDFGGARYTATDFRFPDCVCETALYAAPETPRTAKSDVYSLGMVLVAVLTGDEPFCDAPGTWALHYKGQGYCPELLLDDRPGKLAQETVDSVKPLIERCLATKPDSRPGARDVVVELENIIAAMG